MEIELTRRDFLKLSGGTALVLSGVCSLPKPALAGGEDMLADDVPAILIDISRCTGCDSCALACKEVNKLPMDATPPRHLDADTYSYVGKFDVVDKNGKKVTRYVKRQCMHCLNPSCVSACPAAAMQKSPEGPVVYDSSRCLGCRYCQMGCPFGVPQFDWHNGLNPKISKCWMCLDRQKEGLEPACVAACPVGALHFGTRREMLALAHSYIKSNPEKYIDHVYGEFEVGGTAMLYISDVDFAQLGFPADLPETAPPEETEKIMTKLPYVIGGVGMILTGAAAATHNKEQD